MKSIKGLQGNPNGPHYVKTHTTIRRPDPYVLEVMIAKALNFFI